MKTKLGLILLLMPACAWHLAAQAAPPATAKASPSRPAQRIPIFKSDVDMVLVEVGIHDEHGRAVGNLERSDFHVFEDGKEQPISSFSHEELPLAVALVIDNSSSIMAALDELRAGALDTLALLSRQDRVAIFSFGEKPELEEGLTSDHQALSVDLWALSPYGGTDITDALYEAAMYLGDNAHDSRRAVILVSDNEPSDETRDAAQVVRAAQQSGTPIYSVKVGYLEHSRSFFLSHSEARLHDVEKICRQSGGTMIDTRSGQSVSSAMETILKWLKQGYTLGYYPTNRQRDDGTYHSIEVRLDPHGAARKRNYTVYARQGYYAAPAQQP